MRSYRSYIDIHRQANNYTICEYENVDASDGALVYKDHVKQVGR